MTAHRIARPAPKPQADLARTPAGAPEARQKFSDLLRQRRESLVPLLDQVPPIEAVECRDDSQSRADDEPVPPPEASPPPPPVHVHGRVPAPPPSPILPAPTPLEGATATRAVEAVAPVDLQGQQLVARVADTIAGFCNERAVSESEGWQVRMALRPDVLPSTTLSLAISPHWLNLRFDIGDPQTRRLVCEHQIELARMLSETLECRREIDITFD
jgi:Type III secretion protein (HpaP)